MDERRRAETHGSRFFYPPHANRLLTDIRPGSRKRGRVPKLNKERPQASKSANLPPQKRRTNPWNVHQHMRGFGASQSYRDQGPAGKEDLRIQAESMQGVIDKTLERPLPCPACPGTDGAGLSTKTMKGLRKRRIRLNTGMYDASGFWAGSCGLGEAAGALKANLLQATGKGQAVSDAVHTALCPAGP